VQALRHNEAFVNKQVNIMENRLMKSKKDYMQAKATAEALRSEINFYRRERLLHDDAYVDMQRIYKSHIVKLDDLAETINERDTLTARLIEKKEKYSAMAETEYTSLSAVWVGVGQEVKEAIKDAKKKSKSEEPSNLGTLTLEQEQEFQLRTMVSDWQHVLIHANTKRAQAKLKFLSDNFNKLAKAMNLQTVEEVVDMINKLESEKFTLFNATNDILQQQKEVRDQIQQFRRRYMPSFSILSILRHNNVLTLYKHIKYCLPPYSCL
jgi:hypothetical protein